MVVGLGNPGHEYEDTPHTVGQSVVEDMALGVGAPWRRIGETMVAEDQRHGETVYLVKPLSWMNVSGTSLSDLAHRLGFRPKQCVIVHDDVDLPLGTVRARMKGSDGGHKGIRSVLEGFGTDAVRRVKVGVGRGEDPGQIIDHVLTPFSASDLRRIEVARGVAVERVRHLLRSRHI